MTEDLVKVAAVKMKKKRWTEHSYLMELDGSKKRKRWKNDRSKISGSAVQYIGVSLTKRENVRIRYTAGVWLGWRRRSERQADQERIVTWKSRLKKISLEML